VQDLIRGDVKIVTWFHEISAQVNCIELVTYIASGGRMTVYSELENGLKKTVVACFMVTYLEQIRKTGHLNRDSFWAVFDSRAFRI
jgi:hypothetical protein